LECERFSLSRKGSIGLRHAMTGYDGSGTSKAATVLALSGWAAPHPVTTTQIARVTPHTQRILLRLKALTSAVGEKPMHCGSQCLGVRMTACGPIQADGDTLAHGSMDVIGYWRTPP
jgi:hypothetical protein